jgi:hypothetical protein
LSFNGPVETIPVIYLIAANRVLTRVVPLGRLLLPDKNATLITLAADSVVSVPFHMDEVNADWGLSGAAEDLQLFFSWAASMRIYKQ